MKITTASRNCIDLDVRCDSYKHSQDSNIHIFQQLHMIVKCNHLKTKKNRHERNFALLTLRIDLGGLEERSRLKGTDSFPNRSLIRRDRKFVLSSWSVRPESILISRDNVSSTFISIYCLVDVCKWVCL